MAKSPHPVGDHFHRPVMTAEVIEFFKPVRGGIFLDATVGGGGHTEIIINELKPARMICIDRDPEAVEAARSRLISARDRLDPATERLEAAGNRPGSIDIVCDKFSNLASVLATIGVPAVSGALFDLGVSLHQITTPERGFSFTLDGPLDMRMSASGPTARDLINRSSEKQLVEIFSNFGQEHYSKRIARAVIGHRARIKTTADLARVIDAAIPGHRPVKSFARVFQALRIQVNDEMNELARGLRVAIGILAPQGRIVVLAYHSLEDRIVKVVFREFARTGTALLLTKKPHPPSEAEVAANPQARSARLRALEKAA